MSVIHDIAAVFLWLVNLGILIGVIAWIWNICKAKPNPRGSTRVYRRSTADEDEPLGIGSTYSSDHTRHRRPTEDVTNDSSQ